MFKSIAGLLFPSGGQARLSILIFHRVLAEPDPLFPDEMHAARFESLCRWVREWFNVLPLPEAANQLREGTLPSRAMSITFDDGYADNATIAWPILRRHGLPATCFVATSFLGGGCMWNDRIIEAVRRCEADTLKLPSLGLADGHAFSLRSMGERRAAIEALLAEVKYRDIDGRAIAADAIALASGVTIPRDLMLSKSQLQSLARSGMTIGGHTISHPILAKLSDLEARNEILGGKQALEDLLQLPVDLFAYPNGRPNTDYTQRDVRLVEGLGFRAAVSTAWGAAKSGSDAFQLPRFTPWDRTSLRFGLRLARNAFHTPVCCPRNETARSLA